MYLLFCRKATLASIFLPWAFKHLLLLWWVSAWQSCCNMSVAHISPLGIMRALFQTVSECACSIWHLGYPLNPPSTASCHQAKFWEDCGKWQLLSDDVAIARLWLCQKDFIACCRRACSCYLLLKLSSCYCCANDCNPGGLFYCEAYPVRPSACQVILRAAVLFNEQHSRI